MQVLRNVTAIFGSSHVPFFDGHNLPVVSNLLGVLGSRADIISARCACFRRLNCGMFRGTVRSHRTSCNVLCRPLIRFPSLIPSDSLPSRPPLLTLRPRRPPFASLPPPLPPSHPRPQPPHYLSGTNCTQGTASVATDSVALALSRPRPASQRSASRGSSARYSVGARAD